jgi:two-component system LytT family response regulator
MRTIIIDDEPKAALMLQIELKKLFSEIDIIGNFQQPDLGIQAIDEQKPDLVFLDIEMPKKSGFDVLKSCKFKKMQVIFATAYSEYALQAIKANALDYILKPIDNDELESAVKKAKQKIEEQNFNQFQFLIDKLENDEKDFIKIPSGDQILFFQAEEIIYCKAESNYTLIFTTNKKILVSKTLKYMEELLPKNDFIRIHQSFIINKNHIRAYSRLDGGYVTLSNGDTARVAKNKKNLVL